MTKYAIITVKAQTDELHDLDHGVAGVYGVTLADGAQPRNELEEGQDPLEEAALDVFHDSVAIKVLDDFDIDVQVVDDLGACTAVTQWL